MRLGIAPISFFNLNCLFPVVRFINTYNNGDDYMMFNNLDKVKILYEGGYRCIRYEYEKDNSLSIYFKDFEKENIEYINCKDNKEIKEIKRFIDIQ